MYVGSYDNNLYALNSDGTLAWSYGIEDVVYSSPRWGATGGCISGPTITTSTP